MSRDRLGEFRAGAQQPGHGGTGYEMNAMTPGGGNLADFHQESRQVELLIQQVAQKVDQIDRLNQRTLQAVGEEQTNRCRQERDQLSGEIDQQIKQVQGTLQQLMAQTQSLPPSSPDASSRKGRATALTRQFQESISNYQQIENTYWQKSRDRLKRQYKVAKPTAGDEEIEQALDDERAGQIFTQSLLTSSRMGEARRVLREVESRQQEMRQIEKKALELNALFIQLNEIVNTQQEVIDKIEVQVNDTVADTMAANEQVEKAVSIRKRTRKKLWILTAVVIILLIAIALILYFTLR
ncbi:hypothetical protein IWQ62_000630 [Dispira parvispora]|uniref:t-SNARE coiled-coil homology domain-containing protein n=1 Tax=Dispira parvispora TaxID=1520584 RepID=A0A9W8E5U1_9FUNG|nr:hypothetical protein IWQ62_000630 [Dispira parvispora]